MLVVLVLVCWWWESEGGPMPLFRRPGAGAVGEICGGSLTRIRRHQTPLSYSQHHHTLCTHIPHAYMHTCKHTKQISIMHCMSLRGRRCYSRLLRFWWPSEDAQFDHSLSSLCSAASQCRAAQSGSLPRGWAGQASRWRWSSFELLFTLICLTQMLAQKVCWRFDVDPTPSIASFIRQKLSVKYWLKRFARDLVWIQHLALHLVIMIKIFSVITLTQNAIKGAWKGLRRCYIKKTSLNHQSYIQCLQFYNVML